MHTTRISKNCGLVALIGGAVACGQAKPPVDDQSTDSTDETTSGVGSSAVSPSTGTGSSHGVSPQDTASTNASSNPTGTTNPVDPNPTSNVAPGSTGSTSGAPSDTDEETSTNVAPGDCSIIPMATLSEHIATVGIVTFTTDTTVETAKVEFAPAAGGTTITAPVDVAAAEYRTLLLGMKPDTVYNYRVIVNDNCTSDEQQLTTSTIPLTVDVPDIDVTPGMSPGYYVVSITGGAEQNIILDGDGDIVWYGPVATEEGGFGGTGGNSRAKLDFESKYMWSVAGNPACCTGSGGMNRVSMDGSEVETSFDEVDKRHHDVTALPGGVMTFLVHSGECSAIVERSPDGSVKTVVSDTSTLYPKGMECHPNSIHYHVEDDSYTLGDRLASLYVKIKRDGELVWQLGAANPKGPIFAGAGTWDINHGHHMFMQDGKLHFLLFNNGEFGGNSIVREFELDEANMMATPTWTYDEDLDASVLGEVQRLPNGDTMIVYTENGIIREVDSASETVGEFSLAGCQIGYVDYRPTLYGTPTKAMLDYTFE